MSIPTRTKRLLSVSIFSRLQTLLFISQRSNHTVVENGEKARLHSENGCDVNMKKWKTWDSMKMGVDKYMIPKSPLEVLEILRRRGFESFLVGGCVRDLLRRRTPKDFDIITTAKLKQIEKIFNRVNIVGQRFPVCLVHMNGSIIEVTSFDTVAKQDLAKKPVLFSEMPNVCGKIDFVLWRNSLRRDFTINSLFYNPFEEKIYDYTDGMDDLRSQKVRTVARAKESFKEDCARILRGLRIAARLGFSFSEETATAIQDLSLSIMDLGKGRLMMEMNYMLSYGAAEKSLCLLRRFKLLDMLLPFQAAYLAQEDPIQPAQSSLMLMKLFSSMDKLLSCDRPCHCSLWVALLSFHMALVNHPQNARVIWAFSSFLYHGNWREAVNFARESAQMHVQFVPEISEACGTTTYDALVEDVTHFASLVRSSVKALTDPDSQRESMARYSSYPCHALIFISKTVGHNVAQLFDVLVNDIKSYNMERKSFMINYRMLGKGDKETRFVLGKVIMDAMSSGVIQEQQPEAVDEHHLPESYVRKQLRVDEEKSLLPEEFNLDQQLNGLREENECKPVSYLGKGQKVVEKRKSHPKQGKLEGQRESDKMGKRNQPVSNPEQQQKVVEKRKSHPKWGNQPVSIPEQQQKVYKEEVKFREPLSSLFRDGSQCARTTTGGGRRR